MRNKSLAVFVAFYAVTHALMAFTLESSLHSGDVRLYYRFAVDTLHSIVDFSLFSGGFAIEYPPLTALFVTLPLFPAKLFTGGIEFSAWLVWFKLLYLSIDLLMLGCVLKVIKKMKRPEWENWLSLVSLYLVSLLLMTLYFDRLDLLLGALIFIAVLSAQRRSVWPWFWLSAGVCFKVIPVLLGPVFLLFAMAQTYAQRQDASVQSIVVRETLHAAMWCVMFCALLVLPFYLLWGADLFAFLGYHSERGVQLESIYSNVILLAHSVFGLAAEVQFNFGSFNTVSPWSDTLLALSSLVLLLALATSYGIAALVLWRDVNSGAFAQSDESLRRLATLVCLLLLAAILSAKVFSPQYLLWLVPLVMLVGFQSRSAWLFQGLWLLACVLTVLIYPLTYERDFVQVGLAVQRDGQTIWPAPTLLATLLLTLRNGALVVALVALIRMFFTDERRRNSSASV
ncbi:hypothetical protein [Saccharospirillum mangrovi]|uniref:hypothetical protein n=1 Tax=Saccharospirillum mangrovi TaxID=2161747 RepID=UPI000D3C3957|nr:hypothetical protein [Saccharospirillum mangrovi]